MTWAIDTTLSLVSHTSNALINALWTCIRMDLRHLHVRGGAYSAELLEPEALMELGAEVLASDLTRTGPKWLLVQLDGASCLLQQNGREQLYIQAAAADAAHAQATLELVARTLARDSSEGSASIGFWNASSDCGQMRVRTLQLPSWSEIASNYPTDVGAEVERIAGFDAAASSGVLIWHGEPGSGTATALRALTMAWKRWASVHVVIDPDQLLQRTSNYLVELLASVPIRDGHIDLDASSPMLIVLEDAGELVASDARQSTGQGISRLLNLADGLLGQSRTVHVLITTNEPIARLHPAVLRAGRCSSLMEFRAFETSEANAWLQAQECEARVTEPTTLADLYALTGRRRSYAQPERAIGFA